MLTVNSGGGNKLAIGAARDASGLPLAEQGILSRVMDALDVETFFVCAGEEEGRDLGVRLMKSLGFQDVDVVFAQYAGPGARVRVRAYIYRPGQNYAWVIDPQRTQTQSKTPNHTHNPTMVGTHQAIIPGRQGAESKIVRGYRKRSLEKGGNVR